MPRTLAYCRLSAEGPRAASGFTLLELLLVLTLVSLVAGLVGPVTLRSIDAARERAALREVRSVLGGQGLRAFSQGAEVRLDARALRAQLQEWPDGWSIEVPEPLLYGSTGVAQGGRVSVRTGAGGMTHTLVVMPVTGEVRAPGEGTAQ